MAGKLAHPAPTRWEPCRYCGDVGEPSEMVPAAAYRADWKRGWVHLSLVEEGFCRG